MGHTMVARAGSLGASAVLMGAAVLLALTMTYTVQESAFLTPPDAIEVTVPAPPPTPPPAPAPHTQTQPVAGPTVLSPLPPIAIDTGAEPIAYTGLVGPPAPIQITSPRWQERPRNLQRYYPARALERNIEGEVLLDCLVRVSGLLDCSVVSESPTGWGFADAAQRISRAYRMVPATREGIAVEGRYAMRVPFDIR